MTAVGTAAIGSLRRSVETIGRAEEKRLRAIRTAFLKAITAHGRELGRALSGKK
jgi:hypothetical protein